MRRYFARKLALYLLTFVVAVSIDWAIPRFMAGGPVAQQIDRMHQILTPEAAEVQRTYYTRAFGLDAPVWEQYGRFWVALAHGDLGTSIWQYPRPVSSLIWHAAPFTLALLLPAILVGFWAGNTAGALAARRKVLDNTLLPVSYLLTATPHMFLALVLAWGAATVLGVLPPAGAYDYSLVPAWTGEFAVSFLEHWLLPFGALFLVAFGGWAIGMRNMVIYELEADYVQYLESLGAPQRLVRRYAFRNAVLPQVSGLALALGTAIAGTLVTEIVFGYPGLGSLIVSAVHKQDYFLLQGIFLFVVTGVLVANFLVDVAYVVIDPRTRVGMRAAPS